MRRQAILPHLIPIDYIKVPFLWSLYYLKHDFTNEAAIKDIISRGGDTRTNAAIVGGLIGAAKGFEEIKSIEDIDGVLHQILSII